MVLIGSVDKTVGFERVAPILPVADLDATLERYRLLGFAVEPYRGGERYGFVQRGPVQLHLREVSLVDPDQARTHVYLYVDDADALHAEWTRAGVDGELNPPFDTDYGLREFGYVDPDGNLHRVGSPLRNEQMRR